MSNKVTTIKAMRPDGHYDGKYGRMYKFFLTFENGESGEASAKSENPWYSEGKEVSYKITGEFKGQNKVSVSKPEFEGLNATPVENQKFVGNDAPQQRQQFSGDSAAGAGGKKPINGQRNGMILNNAVAMLIASCETQNLKNLKFKIDLLLSGADYVDGVSSGEIRKSSFQMQEEEGQTHEQVQKAMDALPQEAVDAVNSVNKVEEEEVDLPF
jgi:hypothetical protein